MSGIHDPHTLREESQWPDPFSFQIPSGSVKVTEKPMKRAGLWTLMDAVDVGKTFFFCFSRRGALDQAAGRSGRSGSPARRVAGAAGDAGGGFSA